MVDTAYVRPPKLKVWGSSSCCGEQLECHLAESSLTFIDPGTRNIDIKYTLCVHRIDIVLLLYLVTSFTVA